MLSTAAASADSTTRDSLGLCVAQPATQLAVVTITGLPVTERLAAEAVFVDAISSSPPPVAPGTNVFDACWFIRWRADGKGTVACREVINGTDQELTGLQNRLDKLSLATGCTASLTAVG